MTINLEGAAAETISAIFQGVKRAFGYWFPYFLSIQAGRVLLRGGASSRRFFSSCGRLLMSNIMPLRFPSWRFDEEVAGGGGGISFGPAPWRSLISWGRLLVEKIMPCRRVDRDEVEAGVRWTRAFGGGFTFRGRVMFFEGAPIGQTGEYIVWIIQTLTWTPDDWKDIREP
jgi:hypothetical protein